jgi:cation transport ATPase
MGADATVIRQFIEDKLKVEKKADTSSDSQTVSALDTRPMSANPIVRMAPKTAAIFGLYALVSMTIVLFGVSLINPALFTMLAIAMLFVLIIGLAICLGAFVFNR